MDFLTLNGSSQQKQNILQKYITNINNSAGTHVT